MQPDGAWFILDCASLSDGFWRFDNPGLMSQHEADGISVPGAGDRPTGLFDLPRVRAYRSSIGPGGIREPTVPRIVEFRHRPPVSWFLRARQDVKLTGNNKTPCYEDELLICCTRVSLSDEIRDRLESLLGQQLDWQTVLNRSWWHRIRPLVWRHLSAQPAGRVPAAFLEILRGHACELEQRNRQLMKMQQRVSGLFEDSSLPMLVFKGPTLAIDAYGDLSLRECGDLDMLIRPDDFPRVREMLVADGFVCLWDQVDSHRKHQLFACEFQKEGIELDIHWDLAPGWHNYHVDFDRLWEGGNPFESPGHFTRKLRPEDAMEVLCMHGSRHWWDRLRWICDIAELVNSHSITDWNRMETTATEGRCHRSVWLGLWLASDLLDARLPPEIQGKLERSPVVKRLAAQVNVWLENADQAAEIRKLPERFLFRMRLCDRMRDRLPQLVHYLLARPSRSAN